MAAGRAVLRKVRKAEPALPETRAKTRGGEANVQRILDAALSVFAMHGFTGARIDAIAGMAGLSKPNLLYYFRTKQHLYLAVLRRTLDMWIVPLARIEAHSDPRAALADYVTEKLEYARDHPKASRLFAIEVMRGAPVLKDLLGGELKTLVDGKVMLLRRWMAQGRLPRRDPHHLIFMIWATTQHYADFSSQVEAITGRTLHHPAFFAAARQSILHAILGPEPPS
ncbi:MAG: TetR family transcriptional regulator C-terminal domain-containing protein [Bradyrhizobium sp.]|uniref:TetR family transcriptional regulator C-terminal domain-containing protein n=1 Tax=Bradyrhizobium sp. TaxID=376 RepID=UPI001D552997|nr:TetR family transcriptional regulator C-terminal domain-containing protein [Bradyrhizobium sp.]MBV9564348.1 TetR family transcriptional regulator C-terminal domain-containing protein [Bradyrhizobium sp.]